MKNNAILFFSLILSVSSFAANKAPDFTLKIIGATVHAYAPSGFHFNQEAPSALLSGPQGTMKVAPTRKTKQEVEFKLSEGVVSLYLCDEALSFCENHRVPVPSTGAPSEVPRSVKTTRDRRSEQGNHQREGFYLDQPKLALSQAKEKDAIVLIDFYAIWCPGCNLLDRDVFKSKQFKELTKNWIKLKMDADRESSWDLKAQYGITGYPTVVFLNSSGKEIHRVVGFTNQEDFLKELNTAQQNKDHPLEDLRALAEKGDVAAIERLGLYNLQRGAFDEASTLLAKVPTLRQKWFASELAKEGPDWEELAKKMISEYPTSPEVLEVRAKLASKLKDGGKEAASQILTREQLKRAKAILDKPSLLKGTDYLPGDIWAMLAEAHEELGENELARAAFGKAAQAYSELVRDNKKGKLDRGGNLEYAYYLWKSGNFDGAAQLYQDLEKNYPREFTFYYQFATMELDRKNIAEAQKQAELAVKYAYGDNRLRSVKLLAKILNDANKAQEALLILRKAIQEFSAPGKLPKDSKVRTHRYFKALQELETKIASSHPRQ